MSERAFNDAVAISENIKRSDIETALATLTGADQKTALASANSAHLSRVSAAGRLNGIITSNTDAALHFYPTSSELYESTYNSPFVLKGDRYLVTVSGTFAEGGKIEMEDADGFIFATFATAGSTTLDLRYGTYNFALTGITNFASSVKSTAYA